ncbi:transketolase [Candidatus Woesearchaeota archaeon]|nr:transketolase [Candidatus Woesearchaeota archaeon]
MDEKDKTCVNTIRFLSAEAVQKANSGHPGAPMGLAPTAYVLWTRHLKYNSSNSDWVDRDRFMLSGGHASALQYSMLHLTGYNVSLEDLKNFRQWGSKTPGHPEYGYTDGIETTTGPLGQGIGNAVGMAIAEEMLAKKFNRKNFEIINHHTYVTCGDGDLMEGISHEACSLAGHLKLGKLVLIYDDNTITIEGHTGLAFSEDTKKRFEAYGWQVLNVKDGDNDIEGISKSIEEAKNETSKPSIIITRTTIAYGSPNKQNTSSAHGSPLGEEEIILAKEELGWEHEESFFVPEAAKEIFGKCKTLGEEKEKEWNTKFEQYKEKFPELAKELEIYLSGKLPEFESSIPDFEVNETIATRKASGTILNAIADKIPNLIGGSADLHPSNNTFLNNFEAFSAEKRDGRNFHYGVREHAMGSIQNGIVAHLGFIPYCGTFLVFSDYMRHTIRLAALMKIRSIFVFTHDSVAVGEDGPTHEPVEHISSLRSIPNNIVYRPADAKETVSAWKSALENEKGPTCLILSRQGLPVLEESKINEACKGAYILSDATGPDLIIVATGSEVSLSIEAKKELEKEGKKIRVVSMPSWELFEKQDENYKEKILPKNIKKLSVEAGIAQGWEKYSDKQISIETFGASAPGNIVMEKYGMNVDNVVQKAKELLKSF